MSPDSGTGGRTLAMVAGTIHRRAWKRWTPARARRLMKNGSRWRRRILHGTMICILNMQAHGQVKNTKRASTLRCLRRCRICQQAGMSRRNGARRSSTATTSAHSNPTRERSPRISPVTSIRRAVPRGARCLSRLTTALPATGMSSPTAHKVVSRFNPVMMNSI